MYALEGLAATGCSGHPVGSHGLVPGARTVNSVRSTPPVAASSLMTESPVHQSPAPVWYRTAGLVTIVLPPPAPPPRDSLLTVLLAAQVAPTTTAAGSKASMVRLLTGWRSVTR